MPHIHEKIDFTVEAFIVHDNKVLLRMHDKFNQWLSVGGHIELHENPVQAIIREVKEETGLSISLYTTDTSLYDDPDYKKLTPPVYMAEHTVSEKHTHVTLVYFATTDNDIVTDAIFEHEKNSETRWFTEDEIKVMDLKNNIRFYALEALRVLG